jgi:hypothetical protein
MLVLGCLSCFNKTPYIVQFISNRNRLLTILGARKVKMKVPQYLVSSEGLFLIGDALFVLTK